MPFIDTKKWTKTLLLCYHFVTNINMLFKELGADDIVFVDVSYLFLLNAKGEQYEKKIWI